MFGYDRKRGGLIGKVLLLFLEFSYFYIETKDASDK
jgi:hypothetical protein